MTSIPKEYLAGLFLFFTAATLPVIAQTSKGFRLGFAVNISLITPETRRYAKSAGIDCIEVGPGYVNHDFRLLATKISSADRNARLQIR